MFWCFTRFFSRVHYEWKLFKTQTVFCAKHKYSIFMYMDFYGKEFMLSLCTAIQFFVYVSYVAIWLNKQIYVCVCDEIP